MAEHFYGRSRTLHTSNGGGELFLQSLLVFGAQCATDAPEKDVVLNFLQSRSEKGAGWKFFPVHPLPETLKTGRALPFLMEIVGCLAQSLVNEDIPEPLRKDFHSRDLHLRWAAFAAEFHELLRESAEFDVPCLQMSFQDSGDEETVKLERLRFRLADASKNNRLAEQLELLTELIELERKRSSRPLWLYFSDKANILLEMGEKSTAITTLREGAAYAEGEDRQAMVDYAGCLEEELTEKLDQKI